MLALFVPLVNLCVLVWLWSRIFKRLAISSGWAVLMWLPFLNAPILAFFASRRSPVVRTHSANDATADLDASVASPRFPTGVVAVGSSC